MRMREALLWLVLARVLVRILPFRKVASYLGAAGRESSTAISVEENARALEVRALVHQVCRKLGWKPSCLVRSVAAIMMLRRKGVEGTLYLGVARTPKEGLDAHAWVRCGEVIVAGAHGRSRFTVLNSFTKDS